MKLSSYEFWLCLAKIQLSDTLDFQKCNGSMFGLNENITFWQQIYQMDLVPTGIKNMPYS